MGNDWSAEYPSTWEQDDVKKWKKTALSALKNYYLGYEGVQWHEYATNQEELELLVAKICFSLYGQPTSAANENVTIQNAYNDEQKKAARKIKDKIIEVYNDCPATRLRVGILFISCKQEENEFLLPIYRVYAGDNNGELSNYVDTNCRVYKGWKDWRDNNRLPMLKYCYPTNGFFTSHNGWVYEFDTEKDPIVSYGTSPACDLSSRILRQIDIVSGVTSLGAGGVAIAAMLTPLGPLVLASSAITGGVSAVYGAGRSIDRLVDKGTHGESLTDLESLTCWLAIIATPAHFATSFTNGILANGARINGRIFSSSVRTAATILNCTTFGVDSLMLVLGLTNLIEKARNDQLTTLDVLQFSMSVFFFGHTLMQPKTAAGIIRAAQQEHVAAYAEKMTNAEAKKAFQKFAQENMGKDIKDNSKTIRTINKINDPDRFFKGVNDKKVELGGRKGNTVLLQDKHGRVNRVNPNRIFFDQKIPKDVTALPTNIRSTFGIDMKDVKLNGEKIFENMSEHQMERVKSVLGNSARNYNKNIINTAYAIAQKMGYSRLDDFLCVVELVCSEVKGKKRGNNLTSALNHLTGEGQANFIENVQKDLSIAKKIANQAGLNFANELKAVYHYRKHGADFPNRLPNKLDFYLTKVPQKLFQDANLVNIDTKANGTLMKAYVKPNGHFGVLAETKGGRIIATMFRSPQQLEAFQQKLSAAPSTPFIEPSMLTQLSQRLANSMGFASPLINISVGDASSVSLNTFAREQNDPEVLYEIARILNAMTLDDGYYSDEN